MLEYLDWYEVNLLLKLAFLPRVLLLLALPGQVVVLFTTFHERNKVMSTIVPQIERNLSVGHLLCCNLHLCMHTEET